MGLERSILRVLAAAGYLTEGQAGELAAAAERGGTPIEELLRSQAGLSPAALAAARTLAEGDRAAGGPEARPGTERTVALSDAGAATGGETVVPTVVRPGVAGGSGAATAPGVEPLPAARRRFGKYEIVRELGHGGMGVVYQAYHPGLKSFFAVKVLLAGTDASADAVARFRREAEAAARLHHPGIVTVHDIGEEEGKTYFAMEYVEGTALDQLLDNPRAAGITPVPIRQAEDAPPRRGARAWALPPAIAAQMTQEIAEALDVAHSAGVIHRDLKPANVIREAAGRLKVMDFGLAKLVDAGATGTSRTGEVMGTPAYMSPELAEGRGKRVDVRSDVYQLGAILYEFLTGRAPYDGDTVMEILLRVIQEDPVPPRRVNPRVDEDVETICLRCLERDPARRYASARDLADDLGRYLRGDPIQARPASLSHKVWLRLRRHRAVAAVSTAMLAVSLGLGIATYVTPGTLNLDVQPLGATIAIGSRTWTAGERPLAVALPAGTYPVRVSAPAHEAEAREVTVRRGAVKDLIVHLRHDLGTLDLETDQPGAEITVDGGAYGSRIASLPFPTGRHTVRAWADRCIDRAMDLELGRGQTVRALLSLESGLCWSQRTPAAGFMSVQPIPGEVARDAPALLTCEGTRIALRRQGDGLPVWGAQAALSGSFDAQALELGGDVGTVILVGREEVKGLRVTCFDPRRDEGKDKVWEFAGPPQQWTHPCPARVVALPDLSGDGVRELAVGGRDRTVRVLDGATGRERACFPLPVHPSLVLRPLAPSAPDRLLFAGRYAPRDVSPALATGAVTLGCIRLADGTVEWSREVQEGLGAAACEGGGAAGPGLAWWSESQLVLLDGRTGMPRWSAPLPGAPMLQSGGGTWRDLDGDGVPDALVPTRDGKITAVAGVDGRILWQVPFRMRSLVDREQRIELLPTGEPVLVGQDALQALDPRTGSARWSVSGDFVESHVLVPAPGAGDPEILARLRGVGLVDLDRRGKLLWTLHFDGDIALTRCDLDVDGDGRLETVVVIGAGQLGLVQGPRGRLWSRHAAGPLHASPVVCDLDGDGRPEVVQLGPWGQERSLTCWEGASGLLRWASRVSACPTRGPGVGDVDRDGRPDLVMPENADAQGEAHVCVFRGRDGAQVRSWPFDSHEGYSVPAVTDLNGDGVPDIVFQRWDKQDVAAVDGRTGASLWRHPVGLFSMGALGIGDLDGDGRPDVVSAFLVKPLVVALRGSDGTPLWRSEIDFGGCRATLALDDLTGDGTPDVLLVSHAGHLWVLDGHDGHPLWTARGGTEVWGHPAVARTPDGTVRILAPMGLAGIVCYDWKERRQVWQACAGPSRGVSASPVVARLRRDGPEVVVVATIDGSVAVLDLASGACLWGLKVGTQEIEADPAVADLDGDGIADIVLADQGGMLQVISGAAIHTARHR